MNSLKPKPPFRVLVMSEESRLGRESIETAFALKQLVTAGVQVWFYLEDRQRNSHTPTEKIMLSLTAFADELEREKARQRTYDAMQRKARAGHVTGGRVFGYDNVDVLGPTGKRSHVQRRVNETEAAVVRRIFELSAGGTGYTRMAKLLNAEGAPSPRPQQGRPAGGPRRRKGKPSDRRLYVGEVILELNEEAERLGPAPRLGPPRKRMAPPARARAPGHLRGRMERHARAPPRNPGTASAGERRAPRPARARHRVPASALRLRPLRLRWFVPRVEPEPRAGAGVLLRVRRPPQARAHRLRQRPGHARRDRRASRARIHRGATCCAPPW